MFHYQHYFANHDVKFKHHFYFDLCSILVKLSNLSHTTQFHYHECISFSLLIARHLYFINKIKIQLKSGTISMWLLLSVSSSVASL